MDSDRMFYEKHETETFKPTSPSYTHPSFQGSPHFDIPSLGERDFDDTPPPVSAIPFVPFLDPST